MAPRTQLPWWLSEDDLNQYVIEYQKSGFFGGINFYRNLDRNWHLLRPYADNKIEVPALFIAGDLDPGMGKRTRREIDGMAEWVPDLTCEILPGVGHLVQEEAPEQVSASLLTFLSRIDES